MTVWRSCLGRGV
ncbi:hypothetical protein LINPERHAP2_LOCUS14917 [Linum perenne]